MTNSKMLRALIEEKGFKYSFLADQLGISAYGFQLKIDNKYEFKSSEIQKLCELLGIEHKLRLKEAIFFASKVD